MKRLAVLLALLLSLPVLAAPPSRSEGSLLHIQAPPSMAQLAGELSRLPRWDFQTALELAGLSDPGPPISVTLEPEGTAVARGTPVWVSGYAQGERVVLFPARSPRYPDGDIAQVLKHEVAHVFVARASRNGPVPRWFNEGLAMFAGRSYGLEDRTRLALALMGAPRVRLSELTELFGGDHATVSRAYAISGAFVNDLVERYGITLPGAVLARVANGESFEDAYRGVTGAPLALEEDRFWRRRYSLEGWISLLSNPFSLWGGIALLAVLAIWVRHRRDVAVRRRWEAEEAAMRAAVLAAEIEDPDEPVN